MGKYLKTTDVSNFTTVFDTGEEIEHVILGKIVMNYPVKYDEEGNIDWIPVYSIESYATVAEELQAPLPPEIGEVGDLNANYIWKYINHYAGHPRLEVDLNSYTVAELKAFLLLHDLPVSGTKPELMARIGEYLGL